MVQTFKRCQSEDADDFNIDISSSSKKCNKPMMERRRRARINDSLNQLKTLVLQACGKEESNFSKLDKADILEMTVKHISSIQHGSSPASPLSDQSSNFAGGFSACAKETLGLLSTISGHGANSMAFQAGLFNHLATSPSPRSMCSVAASPANPKTSSLSYAKLQYQQQQQRQHSQQMPLNALYGQTETSPTAISGPSPLHYSAYVPHRTPDGRGSGRERDFMSCRTPLVSMTTRDRTESSSPVTPCRPRARSELTRTTLACDRLNLVKQEPKDSCEDYEISREYSDSASEGSVSPHSDSSPLNSKAWRPW